MENQRGIEERGDVADGISGQDLTFRLHDGGLNELTDLVEGFCHELFPHLAPDYVASRLPFVVEPALWLAEQAGAPVGFKLSYRTSVDLAFSWLGGVVPAARRSGIAGRLMELQHDHSRRIGCAAIETRTRADNRAMLIVNLRHGFGIVGMEADAQGRLVAILRKPLR